MLYSDQYLFGGIGGALTLPPSSPSPPPAQAVGSQGPPFPRWGRVCSSAPEARELRKDWLLAPALRASSSSSRNTALQARLTPLTWALRAPACDHLLGQQALLEPCAPHLPSQTQRSPGQRFLMTQGHPGIFTFVLGKMWLHRPFALDSLPLPLRPPPITCLLSLGCLWGPCSHPSAPQRISVFICKVGMTPGPAWKGAGGWIVTSASCPRAQAAPRTGKAR